MADWILNQWRRPGRIYTSLKRNYPRFDRSMLHTAHNRCCELPTSWCCHFNRNLVNSPLFPLGAADGRIGSARVHGTGVGSGFRHLIWNQHRATAVTRSLGRSGPGGPLASRLVSLDNLHPTSTLPGTVIYDLASGEGYHLGRFISTMRRPVRPVRAATQSTAQHAHDNKM